MNINLSIVIPCYDEENRLNSGFAHYYSYLQKQKYLWELIFVNDGSKDKTLALLQKLKNGKSNIKITSFNINRGKGYAIAQGIKSAKGKYVLFCDLDHSVPIETIESFFKSFQKGFEVVIGSRRVKGAKILVHQPLIRETLGRGFTLLVNLLIFWGITDATCGFKAFKKEVAKKIFQKIKLYDWVFDAEMLFLCKKYNIKIAQLPVAWSDDRGSKVKLKMDIINSLFGLFKIRINDLFGKYE